MMWNLLVTKPAQKDLGRLPANDQKRIKAVLEAMRENPFSGDIARFKAQPTAWRRRAGNYRIFYDLMPDRFLIAVLAIKRRTSTTY
jgi:mRNA-degrading endonuclease RelE of RelBE toxin-antitoxin system